MPASHRRQGVSTSYDVHCLDCNVSAGFDEATRANVEMHALATNGPALKRLAKVWAETLAALHVGGGRAWLEPSIRFRDTWGWAFNAAWWTEHGDHKLAVIDEYGRIDDECAAFFPCGACGHIKACKRPRGHEGEHADKREAQP